MTATTKPNKAIAAASSAAAFTYFSSQQHLGAWKALAAAGLAFVVTFVATYATSNGDDLAAVARQIEAAMHITNLVAVTTVAPVAPAPTTDAPTQLLGQVKG